MGEIADYYREPSKEWKEENSSPEQTKINKHNMSETQEKKKDEIVLPKEPRKARGKTARHMVIYGKPKCGKTTAISKLKNTLIVDVEDGSEFVDGMVVQPPPGTGPVGKYNWLLNLAKQIKEQGKPYDFVVLDTLSEVDAWSEWVGTYNYMTSVVGKEYNRVTNDKGEVIYQNGKSVMLKPDDPNYQSVHTIAHGYGWRYSREAMMRLVDEFKDCGKICTIFICHIMDKMVGEKNGEQIYTKDLALTGKVRDWTPRVLDCIATVWNEEGKLMISFEGNQEKIGGMRGTDHLQGYSGELKWNDIFLGDYEITEQKTETKQSTTKK